MARISQQSEYYSNVNRIKNDLHLLTCKITNLTSKNLQANKINDAGFILYKALYSDYEFEILHCNNDEEAENEAWMMENDEHGILLNLFELDFDYNEIRTII